MKPLFVFGIAIIAFGVGNLSGEIKVVDLKDTAPPKDPLKAAIKWSKIQNRNGLAYLPNTDTPFNGYGKRAYDNEQVEVLAKFKGGFVVNLKQWRKNGIPRWDVGYTLGKVSIVDVPLDEFSDSNESFQNGNLIVWHENGQKKYQAVYKDGKAHGFWNFWYDNGRVQGKANFLNGQLHGKLERWYDNGQKSNESNFLKGEFHGSLKSWYKSGQNQRELHYNNGELNSTKVWKPNGEKCPETNVVNGNGVLCNWNEKGQKTKIAFYENGLLDGLTREWHEDGQISYEINYKAGKLHGTFTYWTVKGEQLYQKNYVDGEEIDLPEDFPEVANENKVFSLDELDHVPSAIKNGDVVYPESLLGKGLSGEVKLLIQINERGRVMVMEILSATHPLFGKAASIAAENSLYEIPTRDGKPVSAQFHLPIKFTASQPSWSASEQISNNYKNGKVRLELSYTHQSDGLKKDQEEKFSTETILLVDGNFVYALIHAMGGPLRVSFNPHTLISMQGRITSQKLSMPITIKEVAFMDDPRIIIVPLYANPEELRKTGLELFEAPANPFNFDDAVCMDVGKGKLCRIKCMRDQIDGRFIEVQERSFAFETGAFNPGKGNLLFTRKSELLGIMINGDYAFHVKNLGSRIHGGSRTLLGSAFDSDKTNKLLRDLSGQFATTDKRFKY